MKNKIVWLLVSCLVVAALVLGSCAPAVVEEEEEEVVTPVEEEEEEEVEEEVAPEPGKPTYGGTLTIVRDRPILAFDEGYTFPWNASALAFTSEEPFGGDWGQGLSGTGDCSWRTAGFSGLVCHTPRLIEEWEYIPGDTEDTIIYHIRKGVHWHNKPPVNGREMTAEDFVHTWERSMRLKTSYVSITITPERLPTSIVATDKWTVEVKTPPGTAGKWLEQSGELMVIIPKEIEDMRDWKTVVGTGPFTIEDYVPMSALTLVRNPNYWMDHPLHPGDKLPYLDRVKMLIIEDASTRLAGLRTAKLDKLGGIWLSPLTWEEAEDLKATCPDLQWSSCPATTANLVFFDLRKAPFNDVRVRRALQLGVDQKAISDSMYGGNAQWYGFPVLEMPEHSHLQIPIEELPEETRELFEYHPEKAKQLLAEAGYPDGFQAKLLLWSLYADEFSIYQEYWSKIGVDVELDVREYSVYTSLMTSKNYDDMIIRGLSGSSTSHKLYTYRGGKAGPVENQSFVDDPIMEEVYEKMMADYFKRPMPYTMHQNFKDILPYVYSQVWMIAYPAPYGSTAWWPWVKGYKGEQFVGYYDPQSWPIYVWLDLDLKEEMTGKR